MNETNSSELNSKMEQARRQMEDYENDPLKRDEEWKNTLDLLIQINNEVNKEGIFSENEQFSEIKAEDIKYLLIPYFEGEIIQKFSEHRDAKLVLALRFFEEFYHRLNKYEYLTKEKKESYKYLTRQDDDKPKTPSMDQMNKERTEKIAMFKYRKALSETIKKYEKEKNYDNIRDYWVAYLELCWVKMIDSIKSIKSEQEMISFGKTNKEEIEKARSMAQKANITGVKKGLELLKITPDNFKNLDPNHKLLQNIQMKSSHVNCNDCASNVPHSHGQNIGTDVNSIVQGYTHVRENVFKPHNMPTMTLDEFAAKEMAYAKEQEEKQKQYNAEKPDSDSEDEKVSEMKTYQKREWDDWKDDHPKGSGNRKK